MKDTRLALVLATAAVLLAACGGGGGNPGACDGSPEVCGRQPGFVTTTGTDTGTTTGSTSTDSGPPPALPGSAVP